MKTAKWIFRSMLIALLAVGFTACSDDDDPVFTTISFDIDISKPIETTVGQEIIANIVNGEGVYNVTSSEPSIASAEIVEHKLTINALSEGNTTIIVTGQNNQKSEINLNVDKGFWQKEGVYILNQGNGDKNNAVLSYYLTGEKVYSEIFEAANKGTMLGDTGNDMLVYGSKIYITMTGSQVIHVTDLSGKQISKLELKKEGENAPRNLTSHEGFVYATYKNGYIVKIDTTKTTSIVKELKAGNYPEQLKVSGEKLYVTNSGYGADKTVSVIDIAGFTEDKKIQVLQNPDKMEVDKNGNLYVISQGDYGDVWGTLQKIDAKTHQVTTLANATVMAMNEDKSKVYAIFNQWGHADKKAAFYYDVDKGAIVKEEFIPGVTAINNFFSFAVNPANGDIYVTISDYQTSGTVQIYSKEGKKKEEFKADMNPTVYFK